MKIKILHLYPDLLNLYGDKGNISCMVKRLEWRGIEAEVAEYTADDTELCLDDVDIVFLGGGSDREEKIVCTKLLEKKAEIKNYVENNGVLVAVCGGYQLLGRTYKTENETIEGLGILDITTEYNKKRLIDDVILETEWGIVAGFENHAGRTDTGTHTPLGRVVHGNGNNGTSGYEGVVYKNVIATYLHGPLFPKNPVLCDFVLENALKRRYSDFGGLKTLDDTLENKAKECIINRFKK